VFFVGFLAAFLLFAALGVGMLLWPSAMLRYFKNPWQPDTPEKRVQLRGVGLIFCLFIVMVFSSAGSSAVLRGFHNNILVALGSAFLIVPIFLWILWQFSPLQQVMRRHLIGEPEDKRWELWMSLAFSGLLSSIVLIAFLLARSGYFPK
jgi:Mn2+/Fe2+ NRAMP family transporter